MMIKIIMKKLKRKINMMNAKRIIIKKKKKISVRI